MTNSPIQHLYSIDEERIRFLKNNWQPQALRTSDWAIASNNYFQQKLPGTLPHVFLRKAVFDMLQQAGRELPVGFRFAPIPTIPLGLRSYRTIVAALLTWLSPTPRERYLISAATLTIHRIYLWPITLNAHLIPNLDWLKKIGMKRETMEGFCFI